MRRSDLFLPATREDRGAGTEATKLLVRAGLIREFGSGRWGFTPAGRRVREKIVGRVRAGMDAIGGQAVHLPGLQGKERWAQSGRWEAFEGEMFTLENRDGQELCLAPSHEEGMVHLVDGYVRSYDDLPLLLYQVGAKFRDDHARNGLVRCKEFSMKDAYSFHADEAGLSETYREVRDAYARILADLGVSFAVVGADNAVLGGSASEEFVAPVDRGSDRLTHCTADGCHFGVTAEHEAFDHYEAGEDCPECGGRLGAADGIEVGHVFQLGTRYSAAMGLTIDDRDGREREVVMGSYGLGIDRVFQTIVQQHADLGGDDGSAADDSRLDFPVTDWGSVAPYRAAIVPVGYDGEVREVADRLHEDLGRTDVLLFDDRDRSVGERFAESDLLGLPAKVVVGNRYRETGLVDLETGDGETRSLAVEDVADAVIDFAAGDGAGRVQ
ncbi:MAG: aminoacyl--tRNA ligase-related protein [Halolamina sp.]